MILLSAGACGVLVSSRLPPAGSSPRDEPTANCRDGGSITILFTGNELGELKPCGCSGGQLGGFARRAALLDPVADAGRLVLDTGNLVVEHGESPAGEQDLIKFSIVVQAFDLFGYDVVRLTKADVATAGQLGLLDGLGSLFNVISSAAPDANLPQRYTKKFSLSGKKVHVTIAAVEADGEPLAGKPPNLQKLFETDTAGMPVNVLIVDKPDANAIGKIAGTNIVDCIIVPAVSDEPALVSEPNARPMVVSVGRRGKYLGRVQVRLKPTGDELLLAFSSVAVEEKLPEETSLVELYTGYQQLVKEAGLLEKYPRYALPNQQQFVGSRACKMCHDYEYDRWKTKGHARAYATLEAVGSQYDPECVICHVVGMEYTSGFVSADKTPQFKNMGCENCHGPGSEHIQSLGASETAGPTKVCTDCHTPEHSGGFAGHEDEYMQKITHWKEPVPTRKVDERQQTER